MPKRRRESVYKKQPAMQILWDQRWTVPRAAEAIGVPRNHLGAALYGRVAPSHPVRERLPILVSTPIDELDTSSSRWSTARTFHTAGCSAVAGRATQSAVGIRN